jgi:hypothetical protein
MVRVTRVPGEGRLASAFTTTSLPRSPAPAYAWPQCQQRVVGWWRDAIDVGCVSQSMCSACTATGAASPLPPT